MDWLAFSASVIDSLAWPGAIVIMVMLLRKPLAGLIPLLQRLKYKDLEVEFGKRVEEVSEDLIATMPATRIKALPPVSEARAIQLADISPRAAVMEGWREVERAVRSAVERHGLIEADERASTLKIVRALETSELVPGNQIPLLHELRMLRNEAAHAPEFALSKDSAVEYASAAIRLADFLDSL